MPPIIVLGLGALAAGAIVHRVLKEVRRINAELERVRTTLRTEIVPYGAYDARKIVPASDATPVTIRVERPARRPRGQRS